jgi:hypothetical protein
MSSKSNDQGRAFEMACLLALGETIVKFRKYEKVVFNVTQALKLPQELGKIPTRTSKIPF